MIKRIIGDWVKKWASRRTITVSSAGLVFYQASFYHTWLLLQHGGHYTTKNNVFLKLAGLEVEVEVDPDAWVDD